MKIGWENEPDVSHENGRNIASGRKITRFKTVGRRRFEKTFRDSGGRIGIHSVEEEGYRRCWDAMVYLQSTNLPGYAYQYSYRRVRDPTASEVAMSPGPACRHTHTHISYFPFLFIRIAVGRGPLFESP